MMGTIKFIQLRNDLNWEHKQLKTTWNVMSDELHNWQCEPKFLCSFNLKKYKLTWNIMFNQRKNGQHEEKYLSPCYSEISSFYSKLDVEST